MHMKSKSERDTYIGTAYTIGCFFIALFGLIGSCLFCDIIPIKIWIMTISFMYIIYSIKNEIIPIINHFNNVNIQGNIIQGTVESIKFRGDHFAYAYEIKGYYFIGECKHSFNDYIFYNSIDFRCGIKDLYKVEEIPRKIDIKVNHLNPVQYSVYGIEYLMYVKELYPEYFEFFR